MKRRISSQILSGLVLIVIGGMFLLRQMGYTSFSIGYLISNFWPAILIFLGLQRLLSTGDYSSRGSSAIGGLFFLAIGVYFLGRNLGWFYLSAGDFFKMFIPVMLIGGGLYVIFKPRRNDPPVPPPPPSPPDFFPPGKKTVDVEPPQPLESTLDEQFEQKFGKPFGSSSFEDPKASSERKNWDQYPQNDDEEDGPRFNSAFDRLKDKHERHLNKHYDRQERHARRFQERQERHAHRDQERQERHARRHGEWDEEYDHHHHGSKDSTNRSAFIGDIHMGRDHFQLKHTNISQFIGDTVIDLTNAQIAYGETKINISAFVGDIKVFIPDDMDLGVSVNSSSFIGDMQVLDESRSGFMSNVQFKTPYYKERGKKVRITVSAFIGDVKVKSVG
ncbi:cell wall-active antibiotics response protein LiaF [Paenibacillus agri]|uniref:Cell wall-active antibiotics response protein n=1 Tax=Paenibacillus agri TaxID=2744309 RepID=A0A850F114_9BACL|nr:cell wall-active antibiotics response protein LiaF [Paenibacillus agri]NUU63761.1 cell wall-active antibiotics response protein [Paenibacillus agri]